MLPITFHILLWREKNTNNNNICNVKYTLITNNNLCNKFTQKTKTDIKMSTTHYKPKYSNTISSHTTHCIKYKHIWHGTTGTGWLGGNLPTDQGLVYLQPIYCLSFFFFHIFSTKSVILEGGLRGLNPSPWSLDGSLSAQRCPFSTTVYPSTTQAGKWMLYLDGYTFSGAWSPISPLANTNTSTHQHTIHPHWSP